MSSLTFQQLREANVERCETVYHPVNEWTPSDWATAMAGECGEACNIVKKLRRITNRAWSVASKENVETYIRLRKELASEIADLIIYTDLLAYVFGIELDETIIRKFNQVSRQKDCSILLPENDHATTDRR